MSDKWIATIVRMNVVASAILLVVNMIEWFTKTSETVQYI